MLACRRAGPYLERVLELSSNGPGLGGLSLSPGCQLSQLCRELLHSVTLGLQVLPVGAHHDIGQTPAFGHQPADGGLACRGTGHKHSLSGPEAPRVLPPHPSSGVLRNTSAGSRKDLGQFIAE